MLSRIKTMLSSSSTTRSGIINMCLKPVSMFLSLAYTPLLLTYLGDAKYGLWATLLSIINWINYFDVGIGNGLRNLLAKELSEEQYEEAKKSISTAYCVLTCISGIVLLIVLILTTSIDWFSFFATDIDMRPTLAISFILICVNFVLSLSNTLLYALQLSERVAIRGIIVQVINLSGVWLLQRTLPGSLVAMAILFGTSTMIVNIGNTINIFSNRKNIRPSIKFFEKEKIRSICNTGIKFFIIQIMCLMLFTVDNLLITHYFGAEQVTPFHIADKMFKTAYTVLAAFLVPIWSRTTVAYVHKDYNWIQKNLKQASSVCALFILGYFLLWLLFKPLVALWVQRELVFQSGLPFIMFVFYSIYSILAVECQFINGSGLINTQMIAYCITGTMNIPFSIFLGVNCGMGPFGVRVASTILLTLEVIVLAINLHKILLKVRQEEKQNNESI